MTDNTIIPSWLTDLLHAPIEKVPPVCAPVSYLGTLRPHQSIALGFALNRRRSMLALDCGLGKTHIGIAYMLHYLPALVVCPASLRSSWTEHITLFAPAALQQITIVSYAGLKKYDNTNIMCVVADEAHYLKHESSSRSKNFAKIRSKCPNTLLLTGTPAQRNSDVFHLLKLLDPTHFKHFYHYKHHKIPGELYFAERYCIPEAVWVGGMQHGFKFTRNANCKELALICEHYMLRMKKDDVLQLPDLQIDALIVGKTTHETYFRKKIKDIETLRETMGTRRADTELLSLCREASIQKVPLAEIAITEWMQTHPSERIILFYHHRQIGDMLSSFMESIGKSFVRIDGKTTMKKRCKLLRTFMDDPSCMVGILSMCATSTGLNLQFCTKVFFVELTFLSTHHVQAESRVHRIGQTRDVEVTYLLLDGTTDNMLWQCLQMKRMAETELFDTYRNDRASQDTNNDDELQPL
jgi:SWI/SNF-related matrix-associated actin-dependent regulator 1 of chromatin subfamily A